MVLISFIFLSLSHLFASEILPKFLTKQPLESLRFISMDGRYAYVQRRPGVLGLVSSFKNNDFITDSSRSNFLVSGSRFKQRLIVEVIPAAHIEFNVMKNHKIHVVDYGNYKPREISWGRNPKLHLQDEWLTYYDTNSRILFVENLLTTKKYKIALGVKAGSFHIPDAEMVSSDTLIYTDINESGFAGLIKYNLTSQKSTVLYKSALNATHMELCQDKGYLAIGEFPYEGVTRGSKIMLIKLSDTTNLAGFETIYTSNAQDLGQILCMEDSIYFVKTTKQHKRLNIKTTEAAQINLATQNLKIRTGFSNVTQLSEMDGRVLIPYRGEYYVLEGNANISEDKLKAIPDKKEELPLDI